MPVLKAIETNQSSEAAFEFQNIPDPLSSEVVGIAAPPLSYEVIHFATAFKFQNNSNPSSSEAAFEYQNIPDPLSSEVVGIAADPLSFKAVGFAATFEFQNIPDLLSSEAVGFAAN